MRKFLLTTAITMVIVAVLAVVIGVFFLQDEEGEILVAVEYDQEENQEEEENTESTGEPLRLATTEDIANSGILEMLAEKFYEDTGISLEYIYVETGEALGIGRSGEVDLVLDNSPASEALFVEEGIGVERFPVMFSDFIVVGPGDMVEETEEVGLLFTLVEVLDFPFISRGDFSGTHQMEQSIWEGLQLDPTVNEGYLSSGLGMEATLRMAANTHSFTLIDRSTWLRLSPTDNIGMELMVICEGDPLLFNQYGIIAINPERHPEVNIEGANIFIQWITSVRIQEWIGEFRVAEFGEPLFNPNVGSGES